jgi:H+/Cl- antiporter ClcA
MSTDPKLRDALQAELRDRSVWITRGVVLAFAVLSGLTVVGFTWLSERALAWFHWGREQQPWAVLLWTPLCAAGIVWVTRRWAAGAAGSGIPQVMAALSPDVAATQRGLFVSLRLTVAKIGLTAWGLLGGLSLGREGPSVQIGAGVMHAARHYLPRNSSVSDHGLLIAGGSAGIAAAFNTPLGGIMFAIEELSRRPEQRSNGLIMAAIVMAGLIGISAYGNSTYFGVIRVQPIGWGLLLPGLLVALASGLVGGLFARLLICSLAGTAGDRFSRWRRTQPVAFAAGCGLAVAVIGLASSGTTFGSGYTPTKHILEHGSDPSGFYVLLKFVSTWLTTWSGVPGGIFAPSLAIGAALGGDIAHLNIAWDHQALIALGMAGFLAAVTQAPLTAFIIVMEMVDGYNLVLSLMACAMVSSGVSRLISRPLYARLADQQMQRLS